MLKESLGMLEVKGLVAAITVGDTMAKAANVHIRQKTYAKGHGWTTILVTGDVGSVNAALSAGRSIAAEHGWIVSSKVIARPANMLDLALEPDISEKNVTDNVLNKEESPSDISPKTEIIASESKEEEIKTEEIITEEVKNETKEDNKKPAAKKSETKVTTTKAKKNTRKK